MYLEEYENAAQDARKAVQVDPNFAKGYLRLAVTFVLFWRKRNQPFLVFFCLFRK
jgi:hypothetical protein